MVRVHLGPPFATPYGDLAQLGERLPCTQEVRGSIPLVSTNLTRQIRSKLFEEAIEGAPERIYIREDASE